MSADQSTAFSGFTEDELSRRWRLNGDFAEAEVVFRKAIDLLPPTHSFRASYQNLLTRCQQMKALEKRLLTALDGTASDTPDELLEMASMCQVYKKRHATAVQLYQMAFKAQPRLLEDETKQHRYNAACAAAMAATGKGSEKGNVKEQDRLRKQAFDWLQADLAARAGLLEKDPVKVYNDMRHWQGDVDLATLRDGKELAKLSTGERDAFTKFWDDVNRLAKEAGARYTQTEHKGQFAGKEREQTYPVKMTAGKTYVIEMESPQFDTLLGLLDAKGKLVAENDDISYPDNLNSRIVFIASKDGAYRIVATSFQQQGTGAYTVTVCEFATKKN